MTLFQELNRRGLIAQMTHPAQIEEKLNTQNVTFYIGFDATADSLHVGHFLQLMVMSRLQKAGHRPIALLGTGTTMVGDPTGRTDMRKMLTQEEIKYNAECFKRQMSRFVDFSDGKALIVENGDWLLKLNYIELLRDVGVHFSVNRMLSAECFKSRMADGLSFIEFNYMIMQSYDFLKLNRSYDCTLQMGGDDQWSNILGGIDLVRRVESKEVQGMTFTLLTTKEGKKMGKTQGGAVWLDETKTTPYEFFQYWRNVADADVVNCLKLLTFVPIEEIEAMQSWEGSQLNQAKERLAFEVTKLVHGEHHANKSLEAARSIFSNEMENENIPTIVLTQEDFVDGAISIIDIMIKADLCTSKSQVRRLIEQGGIHFDDSKVLDDTLMLSKTLIMEKSPILKKGKKIFYKITIS
ncbi:MAG: tyrosine--tRNA ligase [Oscillospiraceae bacterium]